MCFVCFEVSNDISHAHFNAESAPFSMQIIFYSETVTCMLLTYLLKKFLCYLWFITISLSRFEILKKKKKTETESKLKHFQSWMAIELKWITLILAVVVGTATSYSFGRFGVKWYSNLDSRYFNPESRLELSVSLFDLITQEIIPDDPVWYFLLLESLFLFWLLLWREYFCSTRKDKTTAQNVCVWLLKWKTPQLLNCREYISLY